MGGESTENKKEVKRKKLKRNEIGNLSVPGGYLGPWAGYSGLESGRNKKEKLKRFTSIVNKNCLEENKEITRTFGTATLKRSQNYKKDIIGESYKEIKVYNDHRREVTNVKFLSEYSGWLSSGLDGKVHLYSCEEDRALLKSFLGHSKGISFVDTCRSDSLLCTGSYDRTFKIWNLSTSGKFLYKYNLEREILCGVHGSDDVFYLGHPDGVISKIDLRVRNTFELFKVIKGDNEDLSVSILEKGLRQMEIIDENNLAFCLYDGTFGIFDLRNTVEAQLKTKQISSFCKLDSSNIIYYDNSSLYKYNLQDDNSLKLTDKITTNLTLKDSKVFFGTEKGVECLDLENRRQKLLFESNSNIICLDIKSQIAIGEISGKVKLLESIKDDN